MTSLMVNVPDQSDTNINPRGQKFHSLEDLGDLRDVMKEKETQQEHTQKIIQKQIQESIQQPSKEEYTYNTETLLKHTKEYLSVYFDNILHHGIHYIGEGEDPNKTLLWQLVAIQDALSCLIQEHYLNKNGNANIVALVNYCTDQLQSIYNVLDNNNHIGESPIDRSQTTGYAIVKGALAHAMVLETLKRRRSTYHIYPHDSVLDALYGGDILVLQAQPHHLIAIDVTARDDSGSFLTEHPVSTDLYAYIHEQHPHTHGFPIHHIHISPQVSSLRDFSIHGDKTKLLNKYYNNIGNALKERRMLYQ